MIESLPKFASNVISCSTINVTVFMVYSSFQIEYNCY